MSGGSFDYAGMIDDVEQLVAKRDMLCKLRNALTEYPDSDLAVAATDVILARFDALNKDLRENKKLGAVWMAVEWHHSSDWGPDAVAKALDEFNKLPVVIEQTRAWRRATHVVSMLPGGVDAWKELTRMIAGAVQTALDEERRRE